MQNYARLSIFGILALVALRVGVGYHFYMEGVTKVRDGGFSSVGFLKAAKGPLADKYQALIWDGDGRLRLDQPKVNQLFETATERAISHFGFTEDQITDLRRIQSEYYGLSEDEENWVGKLNEAYAESAAEITKFWDSIDRLESMEESDTWTQVSSLRGQKERIERERMSEVQSALSSVDAIWDQYESELNELATPEQLNAVGAFRFPRPAEGLLSTRAVDKLIPIFDMSVGILLMIGLLTPLASWAGALFLISVILSQMPGYPGTEPTYYQFIECLALIVLATTDAGRYAGLDFLPWSYWQNKRQEKLAAA